MLVHANAEQKQYIPVWDEEHWEFLNKLNYLLEPTISSIKVLISN
jgi:hypothetical protein